MLASLLYLLPIIPAASALAIPRDSTNTTTSLLIHPNNSSNLCLTVAGGYAARGTQVGVAGCFGGPETFSEYQDWEIQRGETQVKLAGTNWCLDLGDDPK